MASACDNAAVRHHPRLVFGPGDVPRLRLFAAGETGCAIIRELDRAMTGAFDGITVGSHAAGYALRHILSGSPAEAAQARALVEQATAGMTHHASPPLWNARQYKMIYRTSAAVGVALAYDLCHDAWPADFRRALAAELSARAKEFLAGGGVGFNRKPQSNWVGNTKAAAGFIALAVAGDDGADPDMPAVARKAKEDFFAFLAASYGDRGWCCEGLNYLRYAMTTSGFPFLQALNRMEGGEVVTGTPAEWILPLYMTQMVPGSSAEAAPYTPFFGLSYNLDTTPPGPFAALYERSRWRSGDLAMGLGCAPERFRPALLWTYARLFGETGDRSWDVYKPSDALYALANLAACAGMEPSNPGEVMPSAFEDTTLGYWVFRNRWRDRDDFVTAITANARPVPGTYSFRDAGSFRFYGMGTRWAEQGSRADRGWGVSISRDLENVVHEEGLQGQGGGVTLFSVVEKNGGAVGLDLSRVYVGKEQSAQGAVGVQGRLRCMRVDYSGDCGAPALLIVHDLTPDAARMVWTMYTAGTPTATHDGFSIAGADGACLRATVVEPRDARVDIAPGAETRRIRVSGGDRFTVVMTVQRGEAPRVRSLHSAGADILEVGDTRWKIDPPRILRAGP